MKTLCHILLLLLTATAPGIAGAQVMGPDVRTRQLDKAEAAIATPALRVEERLANLRDPFFTQAASLPARPAAELEAAAAPEKVRRPDGAVLALIAQSFQPSGSLILGERRLLTLPGGQSIALGATFTARVDGEEYAITIGDITSTGYTLKLNEATLARTFTLSRSP